MKNGPSRSLRERVIDAAAAVLTREGAVGPLELLQQLRFLEPSHVQQWRKGNEQALLRNAASARRNW